MNTLPHYVTVVFNAVALVAGCAAIVMWLYRRWQLRKVLRSLRTVAAAIIEVKKSLHEALLNQYPELNEDVNLLVASSPVQSRNVSSSIITSEYNLLRRQIDELRHLLEHSKGELIEIRQIDPVLEATLKFSVEHLTKRIETLEKQSLTKWGVVTVVFGVLTVYVALVGLTIGIVNYLRH